MCEAALTRPAHALPLGTVSSGNIQVPRSRGPAACTADLEKGMQHSCSLETVSTYWARLCCHLSVPTGFKARAAEGIESCLNYVSRTCPVVRAPQ